MESLYLNAYSMRFNTFAVQVWNNKVFFENPGSKPESQSYEISVKPIPKELIFVNTEKIHHMTSQIWWKCKMILIIYWNNSEK